MRRSLVFLLVPGLLGLAACDDVPFGPKWNAEIFFPVRYPDVILQQYAPANLIPPVTVPFTAAVDSQLINASTREIFDQDIDTLKADVLFSTQTDIRGNLDISISPVRADLFSTNPALAVTVSIPIRVTAGDTTRLLVNTNLFKTANVLYLQSRGSMRSNTGAVLVVGPSDRLVIGVDLTATVKISQ